MFCSFFVLPADFCCMVMFKAFRYSLWFSLLFRFFSSGRPALLLVSKVIGVFPHSVGIALRF
jgi:hypothetical protein